MRKLYLILSTIMAAIFFVGCVDSKDVVFHGLESVNFQDLSHIEVSIKVENMSSHKITLLPSRLYLSKDGDTIAKAMLTKPVILQARSSETVKIPLHIKASIATIAAFASSDQNAINGMSVSGKLSVKAGWTKRNINIKNIPLSQFIDTFAPHYKSIKAS